MANTTKRRSALTPGEDRCRSVVAAAAAAAAVDPVEPAVGAAEVIVNGKDAELAPPELALDTETPLEPIAATSDAGIAPVSWVALTNVVGRGVPFQLITEPLRKFVPVTRSVKVALPAPRFEGESCVIVGAAAVEPVTVNRTMFDNSVVPVALEPEEPDTAEPGMDTATWAVPGVATFAAGTTAVSVELFTKVVTNGFPFHKMIAREVKPLPFAVTTKSELPAGLSAGLINVSAEDPVC